MTRDRLTRCGKIFFILKRAAPVVFQEAVLADAEMPRLFSTATHYWSMSHGEGWDQAMTEAGATGLHLIAPRHSAYTTYLDGSVADLIPCRVVPAEFPGAGEVGEFFRGAEWWEPDEELAASLVRNAIRTGEEGRLSARERLRSSFTWRQAGSRLVAILEEFHDRQGLDFRKPA